MKEKAALAEPDGDESVCCPGLGYAAGVCWIETHRSGATDMVSVSVYVGLDDHSESIQMCVMTEDGQRRVHLSVSVKRDDWELSTFRL